MYDNTSLTVLLRLSAGSHAAHLSGQPLLLAAAASRFSWEGTRGMARPSGSIRVALRNDIANRQGGIGPQCGIALDHCPVCGSHVPDESDCPRGCTDAYGMRTVFCHMVSRGLDARKSDAGKGWTPGNIAADHSFCNSVQLSGGPVVAPASMARPDLVPNEWTPKPVLLASK